MRARRMLPALLCAVAAATGYADDPAVEPHLRLGASVVSGDITLLGAHAAPGVYVVEVVEDWGEITGDIGSVEPGGYPRLLVLSTDRSEAW